MTNIAAEQVLLATTFRRDGTPVSTPIWPVPHGENQLAFWCAENCGKVKRLNNNPRITLQVSDYDGNVVGDTVVEATGRAVHRSDDYDRVLAAVKGKYGEKQFQEAYDIAAEYFTMGETYVLVTLDG